MIINERNHIASKLVVGIKDKTGKTNALSYSEVQETTNLLSDIASENVVPSILIAENGGYPPTQNGDIRSLFWLFSLMALQN